MRWKARVGNFAGLLTLFLYSLKTEAVDLVPDKIRSDPRRSSVVVLQNRYFTKVWRPEFGLSVGKYMNEAYTDTTTQGVRGSVFFNELIGVELQYQQTSIADSKDRQALKQLRYREMGTDNIVSPDVEVNQIYDSMDVNCIVAPFYGKLNLFDTLIIYSDLYLTAGLTKLGTEQGSKTAISIGAGQRFYWEKALSFRIDFRNRNFDEKKSGEKYNRDTQSIDIGVSYFFI